MADLDILLSQRAFEALRPRQTACRFATISHSFEAFGQNRMVSGSGFVSIAEPRGSHFWLQAFMGPHRFVAPYMASGKHGGQGTGVMSSDTNLGNFIAECKAKKINTVLWIGIVNDAISTLANTDTIMANVDKIAKAVTDAGMHLIVTDDLPAGNGTGAAKYARSADQLAGLNRLQKWLMQDLPFKYPLVVPVPIYGLFVARDGTTGVPADNTMFDSVDLMHPDVRGHARYALPIYRVLDRMFPPRPNMALADNASPYSATLNKRGNLLTNGMLAGDNGSGVATGWTRQGAPAGLTIVNSKLVDPDGTPVQQIALSGTATATGAANLQRASGSGNFEPGDRHVAEAYILIKKSDSNVGPVNLRGVSLQATVAHSSPSANYTGQAGNHIAGDTFPTDLDWSQFNEGRGLFFRTIEEEVGSAYPATSPLAQLTLGMTIEAAVATDIVMQVRQIEWRKTFAATGF